MPTGIYQHKKGYIHTAEAKIKIGLFNKGKIISNETKDKIRETFKKIGKNKPFGIPNNRKGEKHSEETKNKMREIAIKNGNKPPSTKGKMLSNTHRLIAIKNLQPGYWKGKKRTPFSEETRRKIGDAHRGEKNNNWNGGITSESMRIRNGIDTKLWREAVFTRDNWTCRKTNVKGGKLVAHHIKNFAQYPELRFAIDNGITLSKESHNEFHKIFGVKNNTKEQIEKYLK